MMGRVSLFIFGFILMSCKQGQITNYSTPRPVNVSQVTLLDYAANLLEIKFEGSVGMENINSLDTLLFYLAPTCEGSSVGQVLAQDLPTNGVVLSLPDNNARDIYVSTVASNDCLLFYNYVPKETRPELIQYISISPLSPSRVNHSPGLKAKVFPSSGSVELYTDNQCTVKVGQGSANDFITYGIQANLPENMVSQIYAVVSDSLAQRSACSYLTEFEHRNQILDSPVFISSDPLSPTNVSGTAKIKGTAIAEASLIRIFDDSACLNEIAQGDPTEFTSSGLSITVSENSINNIYSKIEDSLGNESACALLTTYIYDTTPPVDPVYAGISPTSPNNSNLFPLVYGSTSSDTLTVKLYSDFLCLSTIGSGAKAAFNSTGVSAGVNENSTTMIYAKAFDSSGNASQCVYMTSYKHNTFAPNAPTFLSTSPNSPTNVTANPTIKGNVALYTHSLKFYDDEYCTNLVGQGTPSEYENGGISLTLQENFNNNIYVTVSDIEGNNSECVFHASYEHSNVPAPDISFNFSFPLSPTNASNQPYMMGTADPSIVDVVFYNDSSCSLSIGSGLRGQLISSGILVTVPVNSTTDIYAIARDEFNNYSTCHFFKTFIHNTINPNPPVYSSVSPVTPNASSITPLVKGTASTPGASQLPPYEVSFYDSSACANKIGESAASQFTGVGTQIAVPSNNVTNVYAKVFDEAGNSSSCTYLLDYTHDALKPGKPIFSSTLPQSPSYTTSFKIKGSFSASADFLNKTAVSFFSDVNCSLLIGSGTPNDYTSQGIDLTVAENQSTSIYGSTINEVGTSSDCQYLTSYFHSNVAPANLTLNQNFDGSIGVNWLPDLSASPTPTYTVERSLYATGPFSVVLSNINGTSYKDVLINENASYYYRIFASNNTGRSLNSSVQGITVSMSAPVSSSTLTAYPGNAEVTLVWGGSTTNMVYRVYRSNQPGGPFALISTDLSTSTYIDESVVNDNLYYYIVKGSNPSGDSSQSNMVSAYVRATPSAPSNLFLAAHQTHPDCAGSPGITLTWKPNLYFKEFNILRGENGGIRNSIDSTAQTNKTYCNWTTDYDFSISVSATWGSNETAESLPVFYRWTNPPVVLLSPGDSEIKLTWTKPNGGNLFIYNDPWYDIYRSTSREGPFSLIHSGTTTLNYVDSSVVSGTPYFYYIQAYVQDTQSNTYIVGPPSAIKSATTNTNPSAPTNLVMVSNPQSQEAGLFWSSPSHYNNFYVYRSVDGGSYSYLTDTAATSLSTVASVQGLNRYYISAGWGDEQTTGSNIVIYRKANISGFTLVSSGSDLQLDWDDVAGVQDYQVYRSMNSFSGFSLLSTELSSQYTDSTALPGVGYYYKVIARFSDSTQGQWAGPLPGVLSGTNTPEGLSAQIENTGSIQLTWVPVQGAANHKVYQSLSATGPWNLKATILGSSLNNATLSALTNGVHYFKVDAKVGTQTYSSSVLSFELQPKPDAPTGLIGNNQIALSWTPVVGVSNYDLLRSTDGLNFSAVASGYASTSFVDSGVFNGNLYFYKIVANFASVSTTSSMSSAYTPGITPLSPKNIQAKSNNVSGEVVLTWDAVAGVSKYNVYQSTSSGSYSLPINTTSSNSGFLVNGLNLGTTYYFVVTALNGELESSFSSEASIQHELQTTAPSINWSSISSLSIDWNDIAGASTYEVLRSVDRIYWETLATGLVSSDYVDSTLDVNTTYFYRYRSVNSAAINMSLSDISEEANLSLIPLSPVNLYANATDTSSVLLNWTASPQSSNYEIFRSNTAGGPYVSLSVVNAANTSYLDGSVFSGNSYFYVVKALNTINTPSASSNEASINLNTTPVNLLASNVSGGIQLNWDSMIGVSGYRILRSEKSGGPYGQVGVVVTNSFLDTTVLGGETYFYVIVGEYSNGAISPYSNEANLNKLGEVNLQVVIELIDLRLSSSSLASQVFEKSQTSFDTSAYDGVASYEFEILSSNIDSSSRNIYLVDSSDSAIATISVPAGTSEVTRFRVTATPNLGSDVYRIRVSQTTSDDQLVIHGAKLLVNQVNATKTKLYFPLLSVKGGASHTDTTGFSFSTNLQSYQNINHRISFQREVDHLKTIADYNAWEIETIVSTSGGAEGIMALYNEEESANVATTETRFDQSSLVLNRIPLDEGVVGFSSINNGDHYSIKMMCEFNCGAGQVILYKAGLWVKLENLSSAIVQYRLASSQDPEGSVLQKYQDRVIIDATKFSTPTIYFRTDLVDYPGSTADVLLQSHGDDYGTSGLVDAPGSALYFDLDSRGTLLSGPLSLSSGDRFTTKLIPNGGMVELFSTSILVYAAPP